ncbi:Rrf2 family transcriptional regulator [Amycolatopsis sp. OK19-0408]|uniref:Rrf2 family transcriptional regulator n=1 Tax=Amycolatopsis iheyensis TaxID=2945988 RepID=A0A9X2SP10_9PSEU|nr:Rrf2 family transcriptional regulator [Amycolatopsis iheyensis]MCR6489592.1 Rrf2 family transcriptional regulator [Amycolatopsis iheyensis]
MNQGVEWAMHVLLSLAWAGDERPVPTARLAASYDLPQAYLHKQLQALARAGIIESLPGAKGGFLLARPPEKITLMDVVTAIEGTEPAFACTEIRKQGMGENAPKSAFRQTCAVNAAMQRAELEWRRSLAAQTIADVKAAAEAHAPSAPRLARQAYGRG